MSRPAASLGLMRMIEAVPDRLDGSLRQLRRFWSDEFKATAVEREAAGRRSQQMGSDARHQEPVRLGWQPVHHWSRRKPDADHRHARHPTGRLHRQGDGGRLDLRFTAILTGRLRAAGDRVRLAKAMKHVGGRVVLNAAPARLPSADLAALVDVVVVNAVEAEALAHVPEVNSLDAALAAARILASHYPAAVVTAGGDGVAFVQSDGDEAKVPAIKVKLISTHGAGDEFIGALAAGLARGATLERAVKSGNEAAARLVNSPHASSA